MYAKFRENQRKTVGELVIKKSLTTHIQTHTSVTYKLRWLQADSTAKHVGTGVFISYLEDDFYAQNSRFFVFH